MDDKYKYNPWPFGHIPENLRRPEPQAIKELGYKWNDPREIIDLFENKLALFAGSKYAVAVDCASHGLFLSLKFRNFTGTIEIPNSTYVSVPTQIMNSGAKYRLIEKEWQGLYTLEPVNIIDGAGRFRRNMYVGGNSLHILSFQIKKHIPIGRGGAILTDDKEAYDFLKLASYDGRDLTSDYTSADHIKSHGWHYYMTPEDAARGIILMDSLNLENAVDLGSGNYPPLSQYTFFKEHQA
jgi:dTDP-4-amino-4,6-dideoxygalactose transaminase